MFINQNRPRRTAAASLSTVGVLAVLSACASGGETAGGESFSIPDTDPTATVKVLSQLDLAKDNMQSVVDAFEQAHPTITIEWQTVPFDSLASTIDSRVSNKAGDPDVYWADQPRISALSARGMAQDLTEVFADAGDAFDPGAWNTGFYQDRLYALPIENSTQLVFCNLDLLQQAGLTAPSAAIDDRLTWEQLAADAVTATQGGAQYGLTFNQFDRYYQLEPLPVEKGGSTGVTGDDGLTPDFTSDEWVDALTWYQSLFETGAAPKGMTPEQTDTAFLAGQVAYTVSGPWLLPQLTDAGLNWGVTPQPTFEGSDTVATPTGSWSVAMNPFSKHKDAAAIFMNWLAIEDGGGYIAYRSNPSLPATVEGKEAYFQKDLFASPAGQDAAAIIDYETANTAVARPSTIGYIEFESILNSAFADIRNGADVAQALEDANDKLTVAWAKYE